VLLVILGKLRKYALYVCVCGGGGCIQKCTKFEFCARMAMRTSKYRSCYETISTLRQLRLLRTYLYFVHPDCSLPISQETFTCPYPEPDQTSTYIPILSVQDPFQYYSPKIRFSFLSGLLVSEFETNKLHVIYRFVLHTLLISAFLI
jgi:hypothetical protein